MLYRLCKESSQLINSMNTITVHLFKPLKLQMIIYTHCSETDALPKKLYVYVI